MDSLQYFSDSRKSFHSLLNKYQYKLNTGDIVAGRIEYKEKQGFLVNIGDSFLSYLPNDESILYNNIYKKSHILYNKILYKTREFFLIKYDEQKKTSILSIKRLEYIKSWKRIKQFYTEDIVFNVYIKTINKGGIITSIENLQAFIPNSHLNSLEYKKLHKNQNINVKLLLINEAKNQIILSEKSALLHLSLHKFKVGEILYGKIIHIKDYGIFLEIYGIIALMHISEISSTYIENIHTIFQVKQFIKIKIIHINIKQGRLSVSKKNLINF